MSTVQKKLKKILELSTADYCIAIAGESSSANLRWANNTSTTNGLVNGASLTVISIVGKSVGSVSSNHFPDESLGELVRRSEEGAKGKPEAQDFMPLLDGDGSLPSGWEEQYEKVDLDLFEPLVSGLDSTIAQARGENVLTFGYASHTSHTAYLATSSGIRRRHTHREASLQMTAKTPDFKKSVSFSTTHPSIAEANSEEIYKRLVKRLEWSKNSISLEPGRYPVILEPAAVAELMYYVYLSSGARDADEGRSAFSKPGGGNRVGEKLYSDFINVYSDPTEPDLERAPFVMVSSSDSHSSIFDNGHDLSRTDWVKDGVLTALITPRYWANKTNAPPRPIVNNVVVRGDESKTLEDMIATSQRALLVTRFWYTRMLDPQTLLVTGLTRDGVFLIEDGQVKGAVNNFRYNMSPIATLAQTTEIGPSQIGFGFVKAPHLRVEDFHMSSVSKAS